MSNITRIIYSNPAEARGGEIAEAVNFRGNLGIGVASVAKGSIGLMRAEAAATNNADVLLLFTSKFLEHPTSIPTIICN